MLESGCYAWQSQPPSPRSIRHVWLTDVFREDTGSRGTDGARRVHAELTLGRGLAVGFDAVTMLPRRAGLQGLTGRPKQIRGLRPQASAADLPSRGCEWAIDAWPGGPTPTGGTLGTPGQGERWIH